MPELVPPFLDLADPTFSVRSDHVHRAREASWYARTNYGLAVLRYDQAARLIRHPSLRQGSWQWLAHHGVTSGLLADWWAGWVLNIEGDSHLRLRKLMNPAFSRKAIDALRPRFERLAAELIDSFAERGRCEFMADFAVPYAARVIAILLGIPEREWRTIADQSATIGLATGVRVREHLPRIEAALEKLYDYADELIADRRRSPQHDLVTRLVQAEADAERLTTAELRDSLVLLMFGGFDTTRNQLGLAVQLFLDHSVQWRLLGQHAELGSTAVEEVMRVSSTTTWVTREAVEDFCFDGLEIKAGTTIHLFCESAGTDPRAFVHADFDITAADRLPHCGFGGGIHYCLGHLVARTDMGIALTALAQRLPAIRPAGPATWLPDSGNTGPVTLPLAFAGTNSAS